MNVNMKNLPIKKYFFIGFLLAVFFAVISSTVIIRQPTVGILLQFGKVQKVLQAGLNFRIPFMQSVFLLDTRIINLFPPSSEVVASDQKRLIVNYYVKYKIVDPVVFYKSIRNETLFNDRLSAIVESEVRERIGYVTLIALLKNARSIVMDQVKISSNEQTSAFGVEVVDVRINKTDLPNENSDAIFKRMQADREKEARELRAEGAELAKSIIAKADKQALLIVAEAKKKSEILRGDGEAKSANIYNATYGIDRDFFTFYRKMKAYSYIFDNQQSTKLFTITPDNSFMDLFFNGAKNEK